MALGAITVGLEFNQQISSMTNMTSHYDLVMHNQALKEQNEVSKLNINDSSVYHFKVSDKKVYWLVDDFNNKPYFYVEANGTYKPVQHPNVTGKDMLNNPNKWIQVLHSYIPDQMAEYPSSFTTHDQYNQIQGNETNVHLYALKGFMGERKQIKSFVEINNKRVRPSNQINDSTQKYNMFDAFNSMFSGFEFMGMFLGVAFLAMPPSCLMFKVLSNAASDIIRYRMLYKIGTRKKILYKSIKQEIGVILLMPAILGVLHVMFGLQMFKVTKLLQYPYKHIFMPFTLIVVFIHYLLYNNGYPL